ncbi:hypothetical protein TWF106_005105 [Orbilia oligospora]|uniref:Uncharacterized protein n=1 Tax=Orbilia oligospora TaxID=2813651 RepID=A0A6G1MDG3_ORBOL|nr:hypothetical protein TWF788_007922 [Orbilia oligospora]KAF3217107.1 hypothetical protein TWF191_008785 [Orbilia oligospora]KAF3222439.1 hypothetical protein TWF679_005920 [Orbilia oligospora]KAF3223331.1 hypothetical protein TWF106_005105 [Orbilia oligospora]KAF3253561.1 hypothetical protein TWF192_003815 [Orbilia oligospora]
MAATLMPFRGPEQELFAHLRSFESYQSPKIPPRSPHDIPRLEDCGQRLTSDLEEFFADDDLNTMSNRWSDEYPRLGSGSRSRSRSLSPCNRIYTKTPTCTIEDLRRVLSQQKDVVLQDMPTARSPGARDPKEKSDNDAGKRPHLGRKYTSLLDTDTPKRIYTRKRVEPGTRIGARSSENNTSPQSSTPTTSAASHSRSSSSGSNSVESSSRTASRPLQPILRLSDSKPQRPRPKPRVSFSSEDQVVIFKQQDETPIKDARRQWRIDSLPRRTDWEEQMARLSLDQLSARKYYNSQDKYPGRPRRGQERRRNIAPGKDKEKEKSSRAASPVIEGSLRGSKSPDEKPQMKEYILPWEKPSLHKHQHIDLICGHEIIDPMPCSCGDPDKVYEGRFSDCRQCKKQRLAKEREERAKGDGKDNTGWWSRLTGKK